MENTVCKWGGIAVAAYTGGRLLQTGYAALAAAPATTGAVVTATGTLSGTAGKVVDALKSAGPGLTARAEAVYGLFPKSSGLTVLSRIGEAGETIISGGSGNRLTQIILNQNGSSIVQKFDTAKDTWNTVATVVFK